MSTSGNSNFKIEKLKRDISFNEEKIVEFKAIQLAFKDYITKSFEFPELDVPVYTSQHFTDFSTADSLIECKSYDKYNKFRYLDEHFQILINFDSNYNYKEVANNQIEGFEDFLKRRLQGSTHGVGEKELRLISKVKLALFNYKKTNSFYLYKNFRKALGEYFLWLEKKIYKKDTIHCSPSQSSFKLWCDNRLKKNPS